MKIPSHLKGIIATQYDLDMLVMRVQKLEERPDPATHIDSLWKRIEDMDRDLLFVINQVNELERNMKDQFVALGKEVSEVSTGIHTLGTKIDFMEARLNRMERTLKWIAGGMIDVMAQLKMKLPPLEGTSS